MDLEESHRESVAAARAQSQRYDSLWSEATALETKVRTAEAAHAAVVHDLNGARSQTEASFADSIVLRRHVPTTCMAT